MQQQNCGNSHGITIHKYVHSTPTHTIVLNHGQLSVNRLQVDSLHSPTVSVQGTLTFQPVCVQLFPFFFPYLAHGYIREPIRAKGPEERPTTLSSSGTMCWPAKSTKSSTKYGTGRGSLHNTYFVVCSNLQCRARATLSVWNFVVCLIHMYGPAVLSGQHINRSWTLLWAFSPHGLLVYTMLASSPGHPSV